MKLTITYIETSRENCVVINNAVYNDQDELLSLLDDLNPNDVNTLEIDLNDEHSIDAPISLHVYSNYKNYSNRINVFDLSDADDDCRDNVALLLATIL